MKPTPQERFWAKVKKTSICWEWTACLTHRGYGQVRINWINRHAHRVSYEWAYGKIPKDMCVMHICDNRKCVRPDHLKLGTVADNQLDMKLKGRARNSAGRGEKACHVKLSENQVREIRKRFENGERDKQKLGFAYQVTRQSIHMIVTRKQWNHI